VSISCQCQLSVVSEAGTEEEIRRTED
jgi:hypothetical protein